jgi:hypothetical protein
MNLNSMAFNLASFFVGSVEKEPCGPVPMQMQPRAAAAGGAAAMHITTSRPSTAANIGVAAEHVKEGVLNISSTCATDKRCGASKR